MAVASLPDVPSLFETANTCVVSADTQDKEAVRPDTGFPPASDTLTTKAG